MSLHHHIRRCAAGALACAAVAAVAAGVSDTVDSSVLYRCPGNDYRNTISAKEAEKLGCRRVEGAPVTVIQTNRPRTGSSVPAAAASGARVDPVAQRNRDSDARRILEGELKAEEGKLAAMEKDYNGGQPERLGDEKNYQRYLDRVAEMRASIERKQIDIAALRREIQKLPPPQ
ncbi:MAG TPA: hypothetical protein VH041_01020 [Caldimonas sp.]|jgi:hypothetical protein|nr:hypothetical protein [Caldimonas sp.]HEX4232860.1 hypothetical protein [Caldimonas sp.]